MRELWYVHASDAAEAPLYATEVSVESDDPTVSEAAAALQATSDRLLAGGVDPRTVKIWLLERREIPDSGANE